MPTTKETTRISVAEANSLAPTGVIRLDPLENSLTKSTHSVEMDLSRTDGKLRFGDLRRAASTLESVGEYESAHRLWTIVGTAAFKLGDVVFARKSDRRAEICLGRALAANTKIVGRKAKYDYEALSKDFHTGLSLAATAKKGGCSSSTVKRAIHYVEQRDLLLARAPRLAAEMGSGTDVSELAKRYDVEPKVMRWIVVAYFDRRITERQF